MDAFPEASLTDEEFDRLAKFLDDCNDGLGMNMEEVDGFFAALVAGPENVLPSEYLPALFGSEDSDIAVFETLDEANEILGLLVKHWNHIAATLHKGDVYVPLLLQEENGVFLGNDWAWGFLVGVDMRRDGWAEFINSNEYGEWMVPAFMLYYEHDEDPEMRPEPITPELRDNLIVCMAAGLQVAYGYFRGKAQPLASASPELHRRAAKVGRNDPCPCGSGKKYKRCCGSATVDGED